MVQASASVCDRPTQQQQANTITANEGLEVLLTKKRRRCERRAALYMPQRHSKQQQQKYPSPQTTNRTRTSGFRTAAQLVVGECGCHTCCSSTVLGGLQTRSPRRPSGRANADVVILAALLGGAVLLCAAAPSLGSFVVVRDDARV